MAIWTDVGITLDQERMAGINGPPARPEYIALGEGSNGEAAGDTALGDEIADARDAATISKPTSSQIKWEATHTFGGSYTITELGLFNAASGGVLYMRHVWSPGHSVQATDAVKYTATMTKTR